MVFEFMLKAVCFPHADDQFDSPIDLMSWLNYDLKKIHRGYYRYRKAPGLGNLDCGSIVFFYKNKLIVGSAVVEKNSRPLESSELKRCDELRAEDDNCSGMVNVVKFFTNSIWVWDQHELVNAEEFQKITGRELLHYVKIEPDAVLELYKLVAEKREEMDSR